MVLISRWNREMQLRHGVDIMQMRSSTDGTKTIEWIELRSVSRDLWRGFLPLTDSLVALWMSFFSPYSFFLVVHSVCTFVYISPFRLYLDIFVFLQLRCCRSPPSPLYQSSNWRASSLERTMEKRHSNDSPCVVEWHEATFHLEGLLETVGGCWKEREVLISTFHTVRESSLPSTFSWNAISKIIITLHWIERDWMMEATITNTKSNGK